MLTPEYRGDDVKKVIMLDIIAQGVIGHAPANREDRRR